MDDQKNYHWVVNHCLWFLTCTLTAVYVNGFSFDHINENFIVLIKFCSWFPKLPNWFDAFNIWRSVIWDINRNKNSKMNTSAQTIAFDIGRKLELKSNTIVDHPCHSWYLSTLRLISIKSCTFEVNVCKY